MGWFDDAVENGKGSLNDFVAAPAATTSRGFDHNFERAGIILNPAAVLTAKAVEKTTGLKPSQQYAIGASGGAAVAAKQALFASSPPPTEQASMLAAQESGLPVDAGLPFVPTPDEAGQLVKKIFGSYRPPSAESSAQPSQLTPKAQASSPTILYIVGAVATAVLAKILI